MQRPSLTSQYRVKCSKPTFGVAPYEPIAGKKTTHNNEEGLFKPILTSGKADKTKTGTKKGGSQTNINRELKHPSTPSDN